MKKLFFLGASFVVIIAVCLFLLWLNMFPNVYHYRNLVLHYQTKEARDTSELALAAQKLQSSIVFDSSKSYNIYLCPSQTSFRVFAPFYPGANATVYESMRVVFLRPLPYSAGGNAESPRRMSSMAGLIATTITRIGLHDDSLASNNARWKSVGYSEYIGDDSIQNTLSLYQPTVNAKELQALIESIKDQIAVTYLMRERRISFDSILTLQISRDSILKIACEILMCFPTRAIEVSTHISPHLAIP